MSAGISLLSPIGAVFVLYYLRGSSHPSRCTLIMLVLLVVFASASLTFFRVGTTRDGAAIQTIGWAASPSRLAESVPLGPDTEVAANFAAAVRVIAESPISGDLGFRAIPATTWVGVYARCMLGGTIGEDAVRDADGTPSVQWDTTQCADGRTHLNTFAYNPPECNGAGEPTPIAGQGYSIRFADCFDTLNRTTWCNRQWYQPVPPVGVQFVHDGVLHLLRRRADNFANTNVSTEPCGQANAKSFIQGYFEARMRWPGVQGAAPAFWMLSTAHATNPNWPEPACPSSNCLSAELDVFEGYGYYPNVFTGTLHRNSSGSYGVPNQQNSNNWQPQSFRLADSWHTYAALWTATEVRWYVDGQLTHSWPVSGSTNQRMHLILSHGNTPWMPENAVNLSTPDVLDFEVDWVRVWQR
jgi:Glycosyl hydrolases family 16